jgi:hypothetical protein
VLPTRVFRETSQPENQIKPLILLVSPQGFEPWTP